MTMPVSLCAASSRTVDSSLTLEQAYLSQSGGFTVTFLISDLLPELSGAETVVDIDEQAAHVDDGRLIISVRFHIGPVASAATAATTYDAAPDDEQSRDESGAKTEEAAGRNSDSLTPGS